MAVQPSEWPPITYEEVIWDVHPGTGMPRQDRRWVGRPYRAAVVPAIAGLEPVVPTDVAALAEEAAFELARFDATMGGELAPYGAILLRGEAASSSRIEGITAGARAVAEAEATGGGGRNAVEIVANTTAMQRALQAGRNLGTEAVLGMHRALMETAEPSIAGRLREDQVWIGAKNHPHQADFVPPVHERVRAALDDLAAFIDRDDVPVLVQTAVAHAQFETIHPFDDGNGRTGRALVHAILRTKELTRNAAVPVSAGLLVERDAYIAALDAYRTGDLEPIVRSLSTATLSAVEHGAELVRQGRAVRTEWADRLAGVRRDSAAHLLADGLIARPVITAHHARDILPGRSNVHRYIDVLVQRGILIPRQDHRTRDMTWRAQDVLDVLDEYAARVGRRRR